CGLFSSIARDLDVKRGGQDLAGLRVFEPIEEHAEDSKARGDQAAAVARVDAFGEELDRQIARDEPAKRSRAPQAIVGAASRVEAHDEARAPDPILERLDVHWQIVAPALLAALDDDHRARVGNL